jgi:thiamine biosynthesis protein ThiI
MNPNPDVIVCRLGELFIKGRNRPFFLRRLSRNIEKALESFTDVRLETYHGRMLVHLPPQRPDALIQDLLEKLRCIFGLSSLSPAVLVAPKMEAITETALTMALAPENRLGARSFAIRTKRSDKSFPLCSPEISRRVGDRIGAAIDLQVNLENPDLCVEIEIGPHRSFVFCRRIGGAGGLPVGVSGHVLLLLSGGIDSPVAGWSLLKRGLRLSAITFHSPPYTDSQALEKVVRLGQRLAAWSMPIDLYTVRFTEIQQKLRKQAPAELAVVLYRRMMLRVATEVARNIGARALATGDALGQVASQTLDNMTVIGAATEMTVFRPLLTCDKKEIMARARTLDTYRISIEPHPDCCALFVPKHPETHATLEEAEDAERLIDEPLSETARKLAATAEKQRIEP